MTPKQYEELVSQHFSHLGYTTRKNQYSGDYGVDVFAKMGNERLAIQAKMFGNTARKINREMVMQLHGAKDYFDCTKAVLATDGVIIDNALEVAKKLGIEIVRIEARSTFQPLPKPNANDESAIGFDQIWQNYVMPLQGKTLHRDNGETNRIITVDWSGIERITSNGKSQRIQIESFRQTINHILRTGSITRTQINEEYAKRSSSGIVLILSHVPLFELMTKPLGLRLKNGNP